mgnify:CR=1 FL=1
MGFGVAAIVELKVHFAYDDEADVWYVAASDIPGLRLEAENPQQLIERVMACAGELIDLNEAEILRNHAPERNERPPLAVRPVFDSPVRVAA